jgi:tetratricopeptide (TPR) repeat protein
LEQSALLAVLPFVPIAREQLLAVRDSVLVGITPSAPASLETSHLANLHDGVHLELRAYLAACLSLRVGDTAAAFAYLEELERPRSTPEATTVARDAAGSVKAQLAQHAGRMSSAAQALEEVLRLEARVGLIGGSPFYSQGLERYLYAGVLESQGKLEEALRWYSSFTSNSLFDFVYLAPSAIRSGFLLERLQRPAEAAEHYRQALKLYQKSDVEFRPLVREAEEGLNRVTKAIRR